MWNPIKTVTDAATSVGHAATHLVDEATKLAEDVVKEIEEDAAAVLATVEETVAEAFEAVVGAIGKAADWASDVGQSLANLVRRAGKWIENTIMSAARWIADLASDTWTWIKDTAREAWHEVVSFAGWLADVADKAWELVKSAGAFLVRAALTVGWIIMHIDDVLWALLSGFICLLAGKDEEAYPIIRHICMDPDSMKNSLTYTHVPSSSKYVVFSDHHMFVEGSILDRFRIAGNDDLYLEVLAEYAQRQYTLIENGDLEDLWMREPTPTGELVEEGLELLGGPAGEAFEEYFEVGQAKTQLAAIVSNNMPVYAVVRELFDKKGMLLRTIGNHDEPLRNKEVLEGLRSVYPDISINDFIFLTASGMPGSPVTVVTHGHQFDAWNNKSCGSMAGEVITEVVSGLSTIWGESSWAAGSTSRSSWSSKLAGRGFDNELEDLTVSTFASAQSVDEVELYDLMNEAFPSGPSGPPAYPYLILGHTHEPRCGPSRPGGGYYEKYTNSGTAGRYDGLLWCVELENGVPEVHVWYHATDGRLVDQPMRGDGDRLKAA